MPIMTMLSGMVMDQRKLMQTADMGQNLAFTKIRQQTIWQNT